MVWGDVMFYEFRMNEIQIYQHKNQEKGEFLGDVMFFEFISNERNTNISTDLLLRHYSLHVDQQRMSEETIFIGFRNKETVNQMYP